MVKVLFAEDYDDVRRMMKIMLEINGYEAIEASDGYDAVEKAHEHQPDIILMDISMPVLDGLDAIRAIRQFDLSADIPILAVTAYGDFYRQRALDAGCTDVLTKPLKFEDLKATIDHYIKISADNKANGH
ncbi:MAG: response regulator [Saprospiraceae bacterium]|nr:response regulator [Pyrinomonadaceae bacterium]